MIFNDQKSDFSRTFLTDPCSSESFILDLVGKKWTWQAYSHKIQPWCSHDISPKNWKWPYTAMIGLKWKLSDIILSLIPNALCWYLICRNLTGRTHFMVIIPFQERNIHHLQDPQINWNYCFQSDMIHEYPTKTKWAPLERYSKWHMMMIKVIGFSF